VTTSGQIQRTRVREIFLELRQEGRGGANPTAEIAFRALGIAISGPEIDI
jgi:hypothetical protein